VISAALEGIPSAGLLDEDSPHRFGRRCEEMPATVKLLGMRRAHQPKVSFVHQRSGLERVPRLLLRQSLRRKPAQLFIDQGQ
jgi:hypothetical protein